MASTAQHSKPKCCDSIDAQIFPCYPKHARVAFLPPGAQAGRFRRFYRHGGLKSVRAGLGVNAFDGFYSNCTSRLDSKGRVSVPAAFRAVLARDGFEGLYLHPSLDETALDCGGHALLRQIHGLLGTLSPYSEEHGLFSTALLGTSEILKIDSEGRINLSESAKGFADITTEVTFVGQGSKFQIWEPGRFRVHLAEARSKVRDYTKQLGSRLVATDLSPPRPHGARE